MRLEGKVAVVTGGGSGIGEATVARFAEEGAAVALVDIDEDAASTVASKVKDAGGRVSVHIADVAAKKDVDRLMEDVVEAHGTVDILVNNAGINRDALVKKMTEEAWDKVLAVNLKGTFLCAQAAAKVMMEQNRGRIINTSSVGALGNVGQANYAASKAGVIGLTKTLSLELARYGITVNCVAPGATMTPMLAKLPEEVAEMFKKKIPLRRFAKPEEIANLHAFLASDEAEYITGQVIFIDGGLSVGF
jgi:3-oxoacyl-(acyl-carrier-protein) reductase